jgi:hypothetical protein
MMEIDGKKTALTEGWIGKLSCEELELWATEASRELDIRGNASLRGDALRGSSYSLYELDHFVFTRAGFRARRHSGETEQYPWRTDWPEFTLGRTRLVASFRGISILSLRGLAVQSINTPGCSGIIEIDALETDVSGSGL